MGDRVTLRNMQFYGYHGAFDAEKELGQRFEVDVEIHTDLSRAGRSDDLEVAVDYSDIYTIVKDVVEEREHTLIEAIAEDIAAEVLEGFDVGEVVVRVRKPHVPLGGLLDHVEVEIRRTARRGEKD